MILYGLKGTLTITEITDSKFSGHFSGSKPRANGTAEIKGEFKDIPVEDIGKLMRDAGV